MAVESRPDLAPRHGSIVRIAGAHSGFYRSDNPICTRTTWRQVYRQFGVAPAKASEKRTVQNFRSEVLRELKKIKIAWPELNYSTAPGLLILHPSTPTIAPLNHDQLGS